MTSYGRQRPPQRRPPRKPESTKGHRRTRVVITGAQGEIAAAVVRRLREADFDVDPLERGDDLTTRVPIADAIVILDTVTGTDYRLALEAVADAVDRADIQRLVSVTVVPHMEKERKAFLARAEAVESELTSAGYPLTAIRAGLVVGSPDQPAPADAALFAEGTKRMTMPGDGSQVVRPILLEDLATLVIAALEAETPPVRVAAEGPEELSLKTLLQKLNPKVQVRSQGRKWVQTVARSLLGFLPLFLAFQSLVQSTTPVEKLLGTDPLAVRFLFGGDIFTPLVFFIVLGLMMMMVSTWAIGQDATDLLPGTELRLQDEAPRGTLLGESLRRVGDVWTEQTLAEREHKRGRRGRARKYATMQGSYLIAAFLILCGAGALVLGVHDAVVPVSGLGGRLAGVSVAIAGTVMALGGVGLLSTWASRYALGFLGSVTCTITLLAISVSAVVGGDPQWLTLIAALYLIPMAVACLAALWKRGGLVVGNVLATRGQKVLGSVILGGTVATLAQVLYTSVYLPSTVMPTLSREAEITPAGVVNLGDARDHRRLALSAKVKLRNPSKQAVTVLGAFYVVHLFRAAPAEPKNTRERHTAAGVEREAEFAQEKRSLVVERGKVLESGSSLEEGEEVNKRFVVLAPVSYTHASLRVDVALVRRRYRRQGNLSVHRHREAAGIQHSVAKIEDPAWLHLLTRSPRYVHVIHAPGTEVGCRDHVEIAAYVNDDRASDDRNHQWCPEPGRLEEHYGVTREQVWSETPLHR